jgi:hypothetical protein
MPRQNYELSMRAHQVGPLLNAIANGSGLAPAEMRSRLLARMPELTEQSLKRSWNRWMLAGEPGGALPTIEALVRLARVARAMGWLNRPIPADARALAEWLHREDAKRLAKARTAMSFELTVALDRALEGLNVYEEDLAVAFDGLFRTFASAVADHVRAGIAPGGHGLSDATQEGIAAALAATSEVLTTLADDVAEAEFAPVPVEAKERTGIPSPEEAAVLLAEHHEAMPQSPKLTGKSGHRP